MPRYNIPVRLAALGRKRVDVLKELHERGVYTSQSMLSSYINGVNLQPKSELVLSQADKIISEWEAEKSGKTVRQTAKQNVRA